MKQQDSDEFIRDLLDYIQVFKFQEINYLRCLNCETERAKLCTFLPESALKSKFNYIDWECLTCHLKNRGEQRYCQNQDCKKERVFSLKQLLEDHLIASEVSNTQVRSLELYFYISNSIKSCPTR